MPSFSKSHSAFKEFKLVLINVSPEHDISWVKLASGIAPPGFAPHPFD